MSHILHRLDDLVGVIWVILMAELTPTLPELVTQPQVPPHVLTHAKLIIRVPTSDHFCACDVYGYSLFMKKNFFEYGSYITPVRWFNRYNMDHSE